MHLVGGGGVVDVGTRGRKQGTTGSQLFFVKKGNGQVVEEEDKVGAIEEIRVKAQQQFSFFSFLFYGLQLFAGKSLSYPPRPLHCFHVLLFTTYNR